MIFIRNNRSSTVPGTIGDFIKALEKESVLKYVKINDPIFGKKFVECNRNDPSDVTRLPSNNVNTYMKFPDLYSPSFHFTYIPFADTKIFKGV